MEREGRWGRQVYVLVVVLLQSTSIVYGCTQDGPCKCTSDQGTIDLTQIPGSPSFPDQMDQQGAWKFSYSPCNAFSEGTAECQNVAVCQLSIDGTQSYPAGTVDSATFGIDGSTGLDTVTYTQTDSQAVQRTTIVTLTCDSTATVDTLSVQGQGMGNTYLMTLSGPHCCYIKNAPSGGGSSGGGLSVGSILLIVLLCVVVVYIVLGIVIQKVVRKASGREVFPNYALWSALPGTIAEGVRFTFRGCKGQTTYDKI